MRDVGEHMSVELRETALGGLAATEFGESIKAKMWGSEK
jgi:L-serine dehydratase